MVLTLSEATDTFNPWISPDSAGGACGGGGGFPSLVISDYHHIVEVEKTTKMND